MDQGRSLRQKEQISYEISSDSEDELAHSPLESAFTSPKGPSNGTLNMLDLMDEEDGPLVSEIRTPPPRMSAAGHSLRQPKDLRLSLRAQENGDRPRKTQRRLFRAPQSLLPAQKSRRPAKSQTVRNEVRTQIAAETSRKRANFLVAHQNLFLPLLPEQNQVKKLTDQINQGEKANCAEVPYEALEKQPTGVKAVMKPYQIKGLSFLVWMHRNGGSAILGDEMGLGKTLQTLALIQYLKEERKTISSEPRPSLVVCPLSVLSSWIAEARKWTPGLSILRFHGPCLERERLKKVATGEVDQYGNQTYGYSKRRNERRTAKGLPIIDLDSGDKPEEQHVDLVVTTYQGFLAEQAWFKKAFVWNYVILDEGHKIKSNVTLISKALQGLGAEFRLILTGTPLQNNMSELWALLHWLYPDVFTERTSELFHASFDLTKGRADTNFMDSARRLLEVIMLRRMKNSPGVNLNLPPKTEVLLYVPLTPMQKFWYMRLLTRADQGLLDDIFQGASQKEAVALDDKLVKDESNQSAAARLESLEQRAEAGSVEARIEWEESKEIMRQALNREQEDENNKSAWQKLMNILMQLRKCCNHPYTLPGAAPDPYYIGEHVIHASAKFILLDKILQELVLKQKKKILVFSGFTRMLDCCEDLLSLRGGDGQEFKYARLDGATCRARRNLGIRLFNKEQSDYRVMLISTKAGGLGINLATASDVILLDQEWNPQITLQAESRAHRIGQTKPVTVYKLCTQGTVEEQMMGRIQKKLYLSAKVTESMRDVRGESESKNSKKGTTGLAGEAKDDMPQLGTNALMSLVRRGAQTLAHPELDVNDMLAWDWETVLEKCKDKPVDVHVLKDTGARPSLKENEEKEWLSRIEQVQSRVFQGKQLSKASKTDSYSSIAQEWTKESRRVGKNTTVMIDGFAISKESMNCGDWEAVPTFAGKDPTLAEPKREKKPAVVNQDHCQICWHGGDLVLCSLCPRSYHYQCLDRDTKGRAKAKMQFSCPQHQCLDCSQKTTDAGGMLFRCRWCEGSFCEDCLDWEKTELLGENLQEFELLGFPSIPQAYYIKCPRCTEGHQRNPEDHTFCHKVALEIEEQHRKWKEEKDLPTNKLEESAEPIGSETPSLDADAITLDTSGIVTPNGDSEDLIKSRKSGKRKRNAVPKKKTRGSPRKRAKYVASTSVF